MNKPTITFVYCTRCKWMLRAAWMLQETLSTFEEEVLSVSLAPNHEGGIFEIYVNSEKIFSRKEAGGFPDIKELKKMIRDKVAPGKDLGHIDRSK